VEVGETLLVDTRKAWRAWLARHHQAETEIWLISFKKGTGKRSLDYESAVEEALCYGWIDGQAKTIDAERYATRFTPRRPRSNWSESNRARVRDLLEAGKMTRAGLAILPADLREELGLERAR
jgi:uncharacterized protein YdeI (YjbR/CyaY-like superfamily)